MRVFARLEVVLNDSDFEEQPAIERIVNDDVDIALWLRSVIQKLEQEHGSAWEADLLLEPLTDQEES